MMEKISIQTQSIQITLIHTHTHMKSPLNKEEKIYHQNLPETSLLDITHPYLKQSMLSRSSFYGFEVLIYLLACHFPIIYMILNYINKGYFLKMEILQTVSNNLVFDFLACFLLFLLTLTQIYLIELFIKRKTLSLQLIYTYCIIWMAIFVSVGFYLIITINFYFTDRIFIVVCSWILPVKTFSYCIDRSNKSPQSGLILTLKYIISPSVIYSDFLDQYDPTLKIHKQYLSIKALTAAVCLLINYILVTEIIGPYLEPLVYQEMSFPELCFRLTPLFFFEHIVLYYMLMENIMLALAELTQLKTRKFYSDWWNSQTISQFLDKWVLIINAFSDKYLPLTKSTKHSLHTTIIFLMLFSIFSETVTLKMLIFAGINLSVIYFWSQSKTIQNNYIVHLLTVCFQPFTLAAALKYNIFR